KHEEEAKVFDIVEQMPQFPGGQVALMKYLSENIHYPVVAQENGVQGRVVVAFVVERDGSISDVHVARGVD
ncbi:TonB family protein, partial [Salmonella enterica]|uniref:TonB family protein n=1 Tax=Salmonella enterica TaxID=28901 RepID=UPI00329807AE